MKHIDKNEEKFEEFLKSMLQSQLDSKMAEVNRMIEKASKDDYMLKIKCKNGDTEVTTEGSLISMIVGLVALKKALKKKMGGIDSEDAFDSLCDYIDNLFYLGDGVK